MFQLYYTLNKNIQTADLKKSEKEEIISYIPKLDETHRNAIFLLIYEHYRNETQETDSIYKLPYGGIEINGEKKEGVEFNLGKMPIPLRRILFKFIKILQQQEHC